MRRGCQRSAPTGTQRREEGEASRHPPQSTTWQSLLIKGCRRSAPWALLERQTELQRALVPPARRHVVRAGYTAARPSAVSYTHLRAHETSAHL
eukprot:13615381-Alexandrium_andersonii.AAC.1